MQETLPMWIWILYYFILVMGLYFSVRRLVTTGFHFLSVLLIIAAISNVAILIFFGVGYGIRFNENEFEFLVRMIREKELWAYYVTASYIFVLYYVMYKWRRRARRYLTK
ncbi:hypothetical protein [Priestia taiwanensis]|uniref:Uncharacterized protein n=2 Tax=Priestia taiwanensis TaxID=1347902 RepID=A0A917AXY0_9BACI|nr:hypothetical protein [Priestia taiwanensis]MBM7364731.1 hypothetical protein [Priestia taiwanensis]GGE79180.1 hypothetical protein GCM10007140_30950 [Priestia taiwanensis]